MIVRKLNGEIKNGADVFAAVRHVGITVTLFGTVKLKLSTNPANDIRAMFLFVTFSLRQRKSKFIKSKKN